MQDVDPIIEQGFLNRPNVIKITVGECDDRCRRLNNVQAGRPQA
jgi:hypothetical protein